MNDNVFSSYSSCYKCDKWIKIEYYEDTCETKENATFLGDLGIEIYSYCPYCGVKNTGFMPYDLQSKETASDEDAEWDDEDENDDTWWPDAEGVTLVDDDEEEEDDGDPWEMDDEELLVAFTCPDCGQKFRLSPKGCDKIYCYFCGKEAKQSR